MPSIDEDLLLIAHPRGYELGDWNAAQDLLHQIGIPHQVIPVRQTSRTRILPTSKLPSPENVFCIITTQHEEAMQWAQKNYPHTPCLTSPSAPKPFRAMETLCQAADHPLGDATATLALGKAGLLNSILFAASIKALHDPHTRKRLTSFRSRQTRQVLSKPIPGEA